MITETARRKILVSALAADVLTTKNTQLIATLAKKTNALTISQTFSSPKLVRELRLASEYGASDTSLELEQQGRQVFYQGQVIGRTKILYKSPLPGEVQARLAIESAIDRFLEYLQKVHHIAALDESDRHAQVFIPNKPIPDLVILWKEFLKEVAFSAYGKSEYQLPGLVQTFIVMLNAIKLADRGFAPQDFPIVTQDQANVLSAWYFAVIKDVGKRQENRQNQIDALKQDLTKVDLSEKERKSKMKDLQTKEDKQLEENKKYREFSKFLKRQENLWQTIEAIRNQLQASSLPAKERRELLKAEGEIFLSKETTYQLLDLLRQADGDPFRFFHLDQELHPERFKGIKCIANNFTRTATDQINSTTGANFTKCFSEMYRLLESQSREPLPEALLTEQPTLFSMRSPGDASKAFCYSCGTLLKPKDAKWKVARFMFEHPSQRRQSSSSEDRPYICVSCSALSFISPLKVTDDSIILRLDSGDSSTSSELKLKDYLRMLTSKEMHLSAGRYVVLASEFVIEKDKQGKDKKVYVSEKVGQVQYAYAKVTSIFPLEVLTDFQFSLVFQGSQSVPLPCRHLLFIKGLMASYRQSITVTVEKETKINMTLGDAVRCVQQDLPYLADYILTKVSSISEQLKLEQTRELYWKAIQKDLKSRGEPMDSDNQLPKRARLYQDVAALTGLTYAFARSLKSTAKSLMKPGDAEREVGKLIEKVDDAVAFSYYATLGDEKKTSVQARLYHNPDCDFIYSQAKAVLEKLGITDREKKDDKGMLYLQLYADDLTRAYTYFASTKDYAQEKEWKELTYNLKLSLYTRFPELVRTLKSTSEK